MSADNDDWRVIAAKSFVCPAQPASSMLRRGLGWLTRSPGQGRAQDNGLAGELPDENAHLRPALAALSQWCKHWPEKKPEVRLLLDPPFSGTAEAARLLAIKRRWCQLTYPDESELAGAEVNGWWFRQRVQGPWLLDDLARCFLRTPAGIRFLRVLLVRLLQGQCGAGLVVCHSWTHRFMTQALGPVPLPAFSLAPASSAMLRALGLAGPERALAALAADARGNAGVALALWTAGHAEHGEAPGLPPKAGDAMAFVLYALLLHNGLELTHLQRVLPMFNAEQLVVILLRLQQGSLVAPSGAGWQLTPAAYPAVREFLAGREFCLDDF